MASKPPPPSSAAGVPSGNGKFVVIAVLLLLAIGGVAYWKLTEKPPPPVTVFDAGPVTPPPPSRNPDEDIPPPPAIEDAGPDAGKKIIIVQTGAQCDVKKCTGQASDDLSTALAFRAKQSHRCYDNALAQDTTLKGKVSIAVRVGANGSVCSAGVASNDMGTPSVANCVVGYFRTGAFPAPKGGCVDVNVPINFIPRQ